MLRWIFLIAFIVGAAGCRYRQEQVIFQNKEVTLAGTLTLPSCNGPHPAVVFIRGSGPDSRDNYRFYADVFARHGIAKRIYDKRGSAHPPAIWRRVQFKDLAEDALAGVGMLRMRTDIASRKIGLWGGSNGSWVAPLAASLSSDVAFVITVSGAAVSPTELAKWRSVNYVRKARYSDRL